MKRVNLVSACAVLAITGCASPRPTALVRMSLTESDVAAIAQDLGTPESRASLLRALRESAQTASVNITPSRSDDVTAGSVAASISRMTTIVADSALGSAEMAAIIRDEFDFIEFAPTSRERVLCTSYYAPIFEGSLDESDEFRYPLYDTPPIPWAHTRREIESTDALWGREIVWLRDAFDAYIIHVNGSARIRLPGGSHMNVTHAATNGMPYTSIGRLLIDAGAIREEEMSMDAIRAYFEEHPGEFEAYAWRNDRYVFFERAQDRDWPRGSTGATLTPMRSIATDHAIYPPGGIAFIEIGGYAIHSIVVNQDTGGAIVGPNRVDLFAGVGNEAGEFAGSLIAQGRLRLLLLKEE